MTKHNGTPPEPRIEDVSVAGDPEHDPGDDVLLELHVTVNRRGDINIGGTTDEEIPMLGLLEKAKLLIVGSNAQKAMQAACQQQQQKARSGIVGPDGQPIGG
jgi:hypothetical protein